MTLIYDLIFLLFCFIYLPYFIFKRKFHSEFLMRLGLFPKELLNFLKNKHPIWIHAVSVGEVNSIKSLIERLRREYPQRSFIISTVTKTGNRVAKTIAKDRDRVIFLPLDLSFIVKKVIGLISPALFITAETEIWPNLIYRLEKENINVILVNGRISNYSFKGYRIVKFFLKDVLKKISFFCMQTEKDKERILSLGASKDRVLVTGNMKFDIIDCIDFKKDYTNYRERLGLKSEEKLIVAGSTHSGEEEILFLVYKRLLDYFKDLRLLIAPRHIERVSQIERLINRYNFQTLRISRLSLTLNTYNPKSIFLLDTIGELLYFYAISDIVFIGGSLIKKGGHNLLEPAFFEKPIIFGRWMFNFQDISSLFLNNRAAIMVRNKQELFNEIKNLLNNPSERKELGKRAKILVSKNQGATTKNCELIKLFLPF